MSMLEVSGLSVTLGGRRVVDGVSLSVDHGERVGLIGESGSGKSLTCLAILGLLPEHAVVGGSIRFRGEELVGRDERAMRDVRGRRIGCVFQEPLTALDPLQRIGRQLIAGPRAHGRLRGSSARALALRLARDVGLPEPERTLRRYPHELSGGQRQRVMIAMAMASAPELVLADEPTTALDVTVQARILDLLAAEAARHRSGLLLVTHDMAVAVTACDRLLVMREGRIVESGPSARLALRPQHDYTVALMDAAYATSWRPTEGAPA